jgi:DNA-binding CsgD family transcriptional regulator
VETAVKDETPVRLDDDDLELLHQLASGHSGTQIAGHDSAELMRIITRIQDIRRRLGVTSTAAAINIARAHGLLRDDPRRGPDDKRGEELIQASDRQSDQQSDRRGVPPGPPGGINRNGAGRIE